MRDDLRSACAVIATALLLASSPALAQDWSQTEISYHVDDVHDVVLADLDGDGDLDALSAGQTAQTVVWMANDGAGGFAIPTTVATGQANVRALAADDVDMDGNIDIVGVSWSTGVVFWIPGDGAGGFGELTEVGGPTSTPTVTRTSSRRSTPTTSRACTSTTARRPSSRRRP